MLKRGGNSVQVIIRPEADIIADEMRAAIGSGAAGAASTATAAAAQPVTGAAAGPLDPEPTRWLAVFGGATNVVSLDAVATTRLRVVVRDPSAVDRDRLGALDVAWVSLDTFHIVCGNAAARYAEQLGARLPPSAAGRPHNRPDADAMKPIRSAPRVRAGRQMKTACDASQAVFFGAGDGAMRSPALRRRPPCNRSAVHGFVSVKVGFR